MTTDTKAALEAVEKHVGCGDNSCRFVKPTGMATNGGCRCGDRPFVMSALAKLYKVVKADRDGQIDDARAHFEREGF